MASDYTSIEEIPDDETVHIRDSSVSALKTVHTGICHVIEGNSRPKRMGVVRECWDADDLSVCKECAGTYHRVTENDQSSYELLRSMGADKI